jgi:dihydroorotate dehydrogenase (NAD+) catalytic subunit
MNHLETSVGQLALRAPVLTAAGTGGLGAELAEYGNLGELGGVVVKSLAAFAWEGNPSPRVVSWGDSMLNSVGLSGPGVTRWRQEYLPELIEKNATTVASIWGRRVQEFADAANELKGAAIAAIEVNASCPNLEGRTGIFAHSASLTAEVVGAAKEAGFPLWVKLSPNTPDLLSIAAAALSAGADALVLTNTLLGMAIDTATRRPMLGSKVGGVSGPGIFPVALRAVFECREAFPATPLVGVGGISSGEDAIAMIMAGANAVEIGTAIFADPRSPWRIQSEMLKWCQVNGTSVREICGSAHA